MSPQVELYQVAQTLHRDASRKALELAGVELANWSWNDAMAVDLAAYADRHDISLLRVGAAELTPDEIEDITDIAEGEVDYEPEAQHGDIILGEDYVASPLLGASGYTIRTLNVPSNYELELLKNGAAAAISIINQVTSPLKSVAIDLTTSPKRKWTCQTSLVVLGPDAPAFAVHADDIARAENETRRKSNVDGYNVYQEVTKRFGQQAIEYMTAEQCEALASVLLTTTAKVRYL